MERVSAPVWPKSASAPAASFDIGNAQPFAGDQIKRHHIGALNRAQNPQRDPGMGVGGQQIKRDVEEGIVIARLMGDGDVQRLAMIEKGVRRIPVVVAEIPAGVLAQNDDETGPEQDGQDQKGQFPG